MNSDVTNHSQTWVAALMAARKLGNGVPLDVEQAVQRMEAFKSGVALLSTSNINHGIEWL